MDEQLLYIHVAGMNWNPYRPFNYDIDINEQPMYYETGMNEQSLCYYEAGMSELPLQYYETVIFIMKLKYLLIWNEWTALALYIMKLE